MDRFDLMNAPLGGINLLEAAAGTGKTYAIEGLYLRLIIEKALPVNAILVVTYTVAATEELRDRIRRRMRDAAGAFARGESADPMLGALLERFPDAAERRLIGERLRAALRDFDEAAIYTIHGFCQRVLQENAFESDALFDTELITDERAFREEIAADFWRGNFYETAPEIAGHALSCRFDRAYLKRLLDTASLHPDLKIVPETGHAEKDALMEKLADYNKAFLDAGVVWPGIRDEVAAKLRSPALHAGFYGRKTERLMEEMDAFWGSHGPFFPLFDDFEKFTAPTIAEKTKKNHEAPGHDFFLLCGSLKERADLLKRSLDDYILSLKGEFIRTARQRLAARKARENVMFFDDLLTRLKDALRRRGGEELARTMREKYRAALIDEFQDTDPVQFAVFAAVFGKGEGGHPLFLIGDPKQAIYSFRGADIFAYMKAARDVGRKCHITENWRSEPGLIKSVNALFSQSDNPFVFRDISFLPAGAPEGKVYDSLTLEGRVDAPFQWWFVPADDEGPGRPLSREKAEGIICRAVAGEIARLLNLSRRGAAMLGGRPLREADIAVLVRKHRQARLIQEVLGAGNIPSVLQKSGNIFDTREAEEMERIMTAVAMPESEPLLRGALLTSAFGLSASDMGRLATDERGWEEWLEKFKMYHGLWFDSGFMAMFTALMTGEEMKIRLLAMPDGERRITNMLHLAELIHRAGEAQRLGMGALVKWLAAQRNDAEARDDEHQLRMESDEKAVRIVTVHQSKGLEYPVVFVPFAWDGSEVRGDVVTCHGEGGGEAITVDLGSGDMALSRRRAFAENLAENVRLLYVALTRAKNRCYFVWGRFNKAETSAPAYLFHCGRKEGEAEDMPLPTADEWGRLGDADLFSRLEEIAKKAEGNIALGKTPDCRASYDPQPEEGEALTARRFSGAVYGGRRVVSFSSLLSELPHLADTPDYDGEIHAGQAPGQPMILDDAGGEGGGDRDGTGILSFPRGTRSGILLHDILRRHDFREDDEGVVKALVSGKLREKGFPLFWDRAVIAMLKNVTTATLRTFSPIAGDERTFRLAEISMKDRLNELEFYFPLRRLAPRDLEDILGDVFMGGETADKGEGEALSFPRMRRLRFSPAEGFMKGFMDMVFCYGDKFYIVDWKSNFLGGHVYDYREENLALSMRESFYILQYRLYALALHQYLSARLPGYRYEQNFGGVYYFFIRGIDPAYGPHYGIYRARPEEGLMKEMQERLLDRSDIGS